MDRTSTAASTTSSRNPGRSQDKAGESLRENRETALLSRQLATIPTDLPVPFEPEALKLEPPDAVKLKALFTSLEFHSLAAEIEEPGTAASIEITRPAGFGSLLACFRSAPGRCAPDRVGDRALLAVSDGARVEIADETARKRSPAHPGPRPDGPPVCGCRRQAPRRLPRPRWREPFAARSSTPGSCNTCWRPESPRATSKSWPSRG